MAAVELFQRLQERQQTFGLAAPSSPLADLISTDELNKVASDSREAFGRVTTLLEKKVLEVRQQKKRQQNLMRSQDDEIRTSEKRLGCLERACEEARARLRSAEDLLKVTRSAEDDLKALGRKAVEREERLLPLLQTRRNYFYQCSKINLLPSSDYGDDSDETTKGFVLSSYKPDVATFEVDPGDKQQRALVWDCIASGIPPKWKNLQSSDGAK